MSPDGLPLMTFSIDLCLIGHNIDTAALLLSEEVVEYSPQHRFESSGNDIEGDVVIIAELVE